MWDRLHLLDTLPASGDTPQAAVLIPLYEDEFGEMRVVLTKRPNTMPTHAGHISFPGGRPQPEDVNAVATALREAHEEVGIEPGQVEVIGYLEPVDTVAYTRLVVPVVGRVAPPVVLVPSPREVLRVHLPRVADLADPDRWAYLPWQEWKAWYYILGGDTLWGATASMVRTLLGLDDTAQV